MGRFLQLGLVIALRGRPANIVDKQPLHHLLRRTRPPSV